MLYTKKCMLQYYDAMQHYTALCSTGTVHWCCKIRQNEKQWKCNFFHPLPLHFLSNGLKKAQQSILQYIQSVKPEKTRLRNLQSVACPWHACASPWWTLTAECLRQLSKMLGMSVYFCPSFIASLIQLKWHVPFFCLNPWQLSNQKYSTGAGISKKMVTYIAHYGQ